MKRFLIFIILLVTFNQLQAQVEYPDFTGGSEKVFPSYQEIQQRKKKHIPTLLENEDRLDSIWRKEDIWIKGVSLITKEPVKDATCIEAPQWANWKNLEDYFIAQMRYPAHLLEKNQTGYSVAMFTLDTLGLPRNINILTTIHEDFDKEVIRLIEELPHCLPCRNKNGERIECLYTVYVPFLPQHYRDRIKADRIAEEELKQSFVEWETVSYFQDGNPYAVTNYINERLIYNSKLLGNQKQSRGIYTIRINSYGEVTESKTLRSCGIPEWDVQVMEIIKGMPRWTPTINHHGKGEYRDSYWAVSVVFKNDSLTTPNKFVNESHDYAWLIKTLSKSKYPIKLQKKNQEGMLRVAYEVDNNGYIINPHILCCTNRKFKKTTLDAFKAVIDIPTTLQTGKDTLLFQYKLDISPIHPHTDVLIIGYSSCEKQISPSGNPKDIQSNKVAKFSTMETRRLVNAFFKYISVPAPLLIDEVKRYKRLL